MGSIPSTKKPNRNNQCTGRISRQLWVKAPTLSTGSSLSPSLAAAVWCWSSSRLVAASPAVSSAQARLVRQRWSASQLAAVTSTVSVDLDCETWSCSASVPAAVYRPSRSTWIAKREAVRLPSWLQFLGPWARFEEDIHPPTDSLHEKFLVVKQQLITCLTDRNDSPLRWHSLRDWVYMNSHDCILCRSSSSCCVSRCEDRRRSTSLRACVCSRLSRARLSACRRRSCSLLRSSLFSAVKVGRLVLRDSMGSSKLDLWRIGFSTMRKVNTPREGKL